jgi:hypothetical protein
LKNCSPQMDSKPHQDERDSERWRIKQCPSHNRFILTLYFIS